MKKTTTTLTQRATSPIEGYIYKHGAPVSNARIVRKVRSNENPDWVGDEFKTDEKGYFNLPVREEVYSLGMSQFVSATKVVVESGGELVDFWYSNSLVGELYAEFGGSELKELTCELTDEEIIINGRFHNILTKCKWKNMPKTDD